MIVNYKNREIEIETSLDQDAESWVLESCTYTDTKDEVPEDVLEEVLTHFADKLDQEAFEHRVHQADMLADYWRER